MITNQNVRDFIEYQFEDNFKHTLIYVSPTEREALTKIINEYKLRILSSKDLPATLQYDLNTYSNLPSFFYSLLNNIHFGRDYLEEKVEILWYLDEPFFKNLFNYIAKSKTKNEQIIALCRNLFSQISLLSYDEALKLIYDLGFTDQVILDMILCDSHYETSFYLNSDESNLTFSGNFIFKGKFIRKFLESVRKRAYHYVGSDILVFLLKHEPNIILEFYDCLLMSKDYHNNALKHIQTHNLSVLHQNSYSDFNKLIDLLFKNKQLSNRDKLSLGIYIPIMNAEYQLQFRTLIYDYFQDAKQIENSWEMQKSDILFNDPERITVYKFSIQFFKKYYPDELQHVIGIMVDDMEVLRDVLIDDLYTELGHDSIPYVRRYLARKEALKFDDIVFKGLEVLMGLDPWNQRSILFEIGTSTSNKRILHEIANCFLSLGNQVTEELKALLDTSSTSNRYFALFVLSKFEDDAIQQYLLGFVDTEKNDDTRDNLVETLKDQLYPDSFSFESLQMVIDHADKRKKLNGIKEKGIEINELPPLYWFNEVQLSEKELTFLFYRNARSKGLNSDIEARLLTRFIDKKSSVDFSKYILKVFLNQGAQAKQKHLMTLSALLGDDTLVPIFESLFKSLIDEKRVKAAEMVIHNTMVIGTNKALRLVEFISRKYANKKPALAEAARLALEAAAKELSLSADELADRIIPNFDFEDLQRIIEVDGEEFRAMIDMDFSLVFYDENNKKRKSLPKTAPKEIKDEMSAISKDLKSVVRMQSGRTEQFLSTGKQWTTSYWFDLYMNHPIMFVYATKLLWMAENTGGERVVFRVLEDALMVDINDDEIDLEDFDKVLLYHPIYVDDATLNAWKNFCYENEISTYTNQTNRSFYQVDASNIIDGKYLDLTSKEIPKGAEFVKGYLDKRGWSKETIDGGALAYYKYFPEFDLVVEPWIEGPCAFYLEGQTAKLDSIGFRKISDRKAHDLKGVPAVLLSEILLDMHFLIDAR